jgi:Protein of unknown function (DUF1553)/Protein of unknown function (DUF1549)/Planctomycete cytochrome C
MNRPSIKPSISAVPGFIRCWLLGLVVCCLPFNVRCSSADDSDLFVKRVVPILQNRCLSCHNSIDRKGDFSLQKRDEVLESGYIEPGKPKESHFLALLLPQDGKKPSMPNSGDPLSESEVSAIQEWINSGANWPEGFSIEEAVVDGSDWWAFKPMVKPEIENLRTAGDQPKGLNPIDLFVREALKKEQLTPAAPAEPRVLIRRLYYDLIGLPPTPEEVQQFVRETQHATAEEKKIAYERVVDRLLASPRYGEHWARHWLDVVKYADTAGYDKDKLRPNAWPYRDYVVKSFNDDKPYSRFVQEQLAGDVMFPGNPDGILGLGFIAAGPWDWIGHAEVPESKIDGKIARHTDRDEMVSNTINTFCSVTIQCCQCHNHKFDPLTQEHYYNLQSIFAAVDKADRAYDIDPEVEKKRLELTSDVKSAKDSLAKVNKEVAKEGGDELATLEKRIAELQAKAKPVTKRPEFGYHSGIAAQQLTDKWVQVDLGREVEVSKIVLHACHDEFAGIGAGFGFPQRLVVTGATNESDIAAAESNPNRTTLFDASQDDYLNPGLVPVEIALEKERLRFIRVTAKKLALRQNDYIFALAELEVLDAAGENIAASAIVSALDSIEAPDRWRKTNLTDKIWALAGDESATKELAQAEKDKQQILNRLWTAERIQNRDQLQKQIETAEAAVKTLPVGRMVHAAASHFATVANFVPTLGKPRAIHRLHRGDIQQPRELSTPGTFPLNAINELSQLPTDTVVEKTVVDQQGRFQLPPEHTEGERRRALAQWITEASHPLTWRSIVNRVWQYHFGRGLVDTPNDFGRMGELPTHPELLDWLAIDFRDNGQSLKRLHKLIVTSQTYQQSSDHSSANIEVDSDNRMLWRMNRRRLTAEEIRDSMLSTAGKLKLDMGGPGYYLFVLERDEHSPHYEYHKFDPESEASHRRSIYRFIVRSQPDPYMTTLDCADSSQSTPQRNETLTALQALSLLNNDFTLVMSKHFAKRLQSEFPALDDQISRGFELTAGRTPTASELDELTVYAKQHGLPNLCRVLFNLSEFVFVD